MKRRHRYEERSGWPLWVHGLVALTYIPALIPVREFLRGRLGNGAGEMSYPVAFLCLFLGLGIPTLIYALFGQLRVRVTNDDVKIAWGYSELIRKRVPFGLIRKMEAVTYSPIGEFGGWGIRMGGHKKVAWTIRGNRALLLHLESGTRFYLGSEKPERLMVRIQSAGKGKFGDSEE